MSFWKRERERERKRKREGGKYSALLILSLTISQYPGVEEGQKRIPHESSVAEEEEQKRNQLRLHGNH